MITERTAEVLEELFQSLPEAVINAIRPPERLVYAGPRRAARVAIDHALHENQWSITDLAQITTGFCLTWANGHDHCSFVIGLGRDKLSAPMHFVKVMDTDLVQQTVTWSYLHPQNKMMTCRKKRYFTKLKSSTTGAFKADFNQTQVTPFDPDNIILGWDLEPYERQNIIPNLQYLRCQQQIDVIEAARRAEGINAEICATGEDSDDANDS